MFHLLNSNKPSAKKAVLDKGGSLVELIVVIGIIVGALGAILGFAAFSFMSSNIVRQTAEAVALAEEGLEMARNYRDGTGWTDNPAGIEYDGFGILNFSLAPFHFEKSGDVPPRWRLVSGQETIGIFTREMFFEFLHRAETGVNKDNIIPGGGYTDTKSVSAFVRVSWSERGRDHKIELTAYVTDWQQL